MMRRIPQLVWRDVASSGRCAIGEHATNCQGLPLSAVPVWIQRSRMSAAAVPEPKQADKGSEGRDDGPSAPSSVHNLRRKLASG